MPGFSNRSVVVFVYAALILSTLLVFWQVRNFDFVNYDDADYVYENPHVLSSLTLQNIKWAFTTGHVANWHPLTWLSLMLDCQLFGKNPGWMHLMNLILHLANILLLFAVLRNMTGVIWQSAFVAAAFALHPMHVESVAWIAERKDVLSSLFFLLTLAAYESYVRRRNPFRYLLTLLLFALGLMSKPMLVTLPFVLLLVDYWPLNRFLNSKFSILNSIVEKVPFLFLAAVSSVITFFVQMRGSSLAPVNILPLKARIDNAFLSYARYIGKLFVPQNLAVFYPPDVRTIRSWQAVMSVLLLMVITILVIRFARNRRYLPVGWFWFVGTLVPVIGLVQVGRQAFADRYTYIPYIGLFIMLAWGLPELLSKLPQRKIVLALSMVIVLTPLGICTYQQVSYWYNSFTLFSHAIEVTKNNYIAYFSLGCAYGELGRGKDEIEAYKQTLKIEPDYADAHFNLGIAYANLGRYQDAIDSYKQAVKIKPDFVDAHYNLGFTCLAAGDKALALEEYKILKTLGDDKQADQLYNLIYK